MRTPEREVWPLTPRPPVLPLPEPMPRPMRMRFLVAPSLSRMSVSFMGLPSSLLVDDAHEVLDARDHAAHGGRILEGRATVELVEAEADQRLALHAGTAQRAADLHDRDGLGGLLVGHHQPSPHASAPAASASPSRRRAWRVGTLRPRRAATARGLSSRFSASNVARTRLYGFDEPSDFATTSCMPRVSKTARIGPPAMMPVPAGAARRTTRPAPQRPATS